MGARKEVYSPGMLTPSSAGRRARLVPTGGTWCLCTRQKLILPSSKPTKAGKGMTGRGGLMSHSQASLLPIPLVGDFPARLICSHRRLKLKEPKMHCHIFILIREQVLACLHHCDNMVVYLTQRWLQCHYTVVIMRLPHIGSLADGNVISYGNSQLLCGVTKLNKSS